MARLPKQEVQTREQYLKALFLENPNLPMPQANNRFFEKFGSKMRPQRVYDIRTQVQSQLSKNTNARDIVITPANNEESNMAAKKKKAAKKAGAVQSASEVNGAAATVLQRPGKKASGLSFIEVPLGTEAAVTSALAVLKQQGLFGGQIEHTGVGYLVVVKP